METYQSVKYAIFTAFGIAPDAVHVLLGVLIWLLIGMLTRIDVRRWVTVWPVVLLALIMEMVDVLLLKESIAGATLDFVLLSSVPIFVVLCIRLRLVKSY
jgi:hypothetical protein